MKNLTCFYVRIFEVYSLSTRSVPLELSSSKKETFGKLGKINLQFPMIHENVLPNFCHSGQIFFWKTSNDFFFSLLLFYLSFCWDLVLRLLSLSLFFFLEKGLDFESPCYAGTTAKMNSWGWGLFQSLIELWGGWLCISSSLNHRISFTTNLNCSQQMNKNKKSPIIRKIVINPANVTAYLNLK